jgi:hypothetical protein
MISNLKNSNVFIFLVLLTSFPMLFFLAHYPQSPDGYELLSTALNGGVLHPSGMAVQAWIDKLFVIIFAKTFALGLSLLSWLSFFISQIFLLLSFRQLKVGWFASATAAIAYMYCGTLATLAVQPEKYGLMALFTSLIIYISLRFSQNFLAIVIAFALAISQHTGLIFLFPFVIAGGVFCFTKQKNLKIKLEFLTGILTLILVPVLFYSSMLFLRAQRPWPDWGQLETLRDVWNHVIRTDFKNGIINQESFKNTTFVSGLFFLMKGLKSWAFFGFFIPFGLFAFWKTNKNIFYVFISTLILGTGGLCLIQIPDAGNSISLGYASRYSCVLMPVFAILVGVGINWFVFMNKPMMRNLIKIIVLCSLAWVIYTGFILVKKVDSNLIEIYRNAVSRELPETALFVSENDIDLFAGIPCKKNDMCFPIKNLFGLEWYREKTAPAIDKRVLQILPEFKTTSWSFSKFLIFAFNKGYTLASTSGSLFINIPEFRGHIEQTGLVWLVTPEKRELYSEKILENGRQLCEDLKSAKFAISKDGNYFLHEIIKNFHYVYLSAGDALQRPVECSALNRISPWTREEVKGRF